MNAYELPTTLEVGGVDYTIRFGFRAVLDILIAMEDPDLDKYGKSAVVLQIIYPEWKSIPTEYVNEAIEKACAFIDCGQIDDGTVKPRLIDWEQDSGIIIPAVNAVARTEVRAIPNLHWWSFWGYFMEIRESVFSTVLNIRQKKAKHQKLEKWEEDYYRENKEKIDLKRRYSAEDTAALEKFKKWL